jgi:SAM-dependent methyltransferase
MHRRSWLSGALNATLNATLSLALSAGWMQRAAAQASAELDVPFITTPDNVVLAMLDLASTGSQDHVLDLGSGDGRIPITAVLRYGASGVGVEIDPRLVAQSQSNARASGVADRVRFMAQDLFETDLTKASVITMYLLPDVNLKLRPALLKLRPGTRLVSHDWDMGDWIPDAQRVVPAPNKPVGLRKEAKLMLWVVPAVFAGRRSGSLQIHPAPGIQFEALIDQSYQRITGGQLNLADGAHWVIQSGLVSGALVQMQLRSLDGTAALEVVGRMEGSQLMLGGAAQAR